MLPLTVAQSTLPEFGWNIVASANALSAVSGVLAGFVFAALVALLSAPLPGNADAACAHRTAALSTMLGAFFSLVVSALLFSVLAGSSYTVEQYRPFVEGYCLTWILSLALVQMAVSINWLLAQYRAYAALASTASALVWAAVFISSLTVSGVLVQPGYVHNENALADGVVWLIGAAVIFLSIPVARFVLRAADAQPATLNLISMAAVVFMAIAYGVVSALTDNQVRDAYKSVPWGLIMFLLSALLLSALMAVYQRELPRS